MAEDAGAAGRGRRARQPRDAIRTRGRPRSPRSSRRVPICPPPMVGRAYARGTPDAAALATKCTSADDASVVPSRPRRGRPAGTSRPVWPGDAVGSAEHLTTRGAALRVGEPGSGFTGSGARRGGVQRSSRWSKTAWARSGPSRTRIAPMRSVVSDVAQLGAGGADGRGGRRETKPAEALRPAVGRPCGFL